MKLNHETDTQQVEGVFNIIFAILKPLQRPKRVDAFPILIIANPDKAVVLEK